MAKRGSGGASSDAQKRSRKAAAADEDDVDEVPADGVMPEDMEGPETIDDETARSDARAAVGDADEEEDEAEYRQPMEARRRHARSLSRVANPLVRPRALPDLDGVWDAETRRVMMTTTTMTTTTTMATTTTTRTMTKITSRRSAASRSTRKVRRTDSLDWEAVDSNLARNPLPRPPFSHPRSLHSLRQSRGGGHHP